MKSALKTASLLCLVTFAANVPLKAHAADPATSAPVANTEATMAFKYDGGEISTMIADYAKASGRKFIIDPGVRGKATVIMPGPVTLTEAWNILNDVLAINGYSVIDQGETAIVKSARNAQRDGIPTLTQLPPPRPNRMITYILTLKNISAEEVNKRLRILPSKDGEMTPYEPTNQIIISDYATNINRIAEVIKTIDVPESAIYKKQQSDPIYLKRKKEEQERWRANREADARLSATLPRSGTPAPTFQGSSPAPTAGH